MANKELSVEEKAKLEAEKKLNDMEKSDSKESKEVSDAISENNEETTKKEEKSEPRKTFVTYDHTVKYNGKYYEAGTKIPVEQK